MKTLSILGAGKLATTLAYLWHTAGTFHIGQVICRHQSHACDAVRFIGAGSAVALSPTLDGASEKLDYPQNRSILESADVWLIATPDQDIDKIAQSLTPILRPNDIVFHCSGSLPSAVLPFEHCQSASVHPVHSFANPSHSVQHFAGTYCTAEGNASALEVLLPAFAAVGGIPITITAADKALYHASTVMACNYLVTLMDASLESLQLAGISPEQGTLMLRPLVEQTLQNCFNNGSRSALTGPISRGDSSTVNRHLQALTKHPSLFELYRALGQRTLPIAEQQANGSLDEITKLLKPNKDG